MSKLQISKHINLDFEKRSSRIKKHNEKAGTIASKRKLCQEMDAESDAENIKYSEDDVTFNSKSNLRYKTNDNSGKPTKLHKPDKKSELTDYEMMIQANIEEKKQFLKELDIDKAKASFVELLPLKMLKQPKVTNLEKPKKIRNNLPVQVRRSLRLQMVPAVDFSCLPEIKYDLSTDQQETPPDPGPSDLHTYSDLSAEDERNLKFVKTLRGLKSSSGSSLWSVDSNSRLKDLLTPMKIVEKCVAKVVPSRICSIRVHPSKDKTLIFVGSKTGELGIWDPCSKEERRVFNYKIHSKAINCMTIDRFNSNNLYTTSFDGSFRQLNLSGTIEKQIYSCDDYHYISWHSQRDAYCFYVAGSKGLLDIVDVRESKIPLRHFQIHQKKSVKVVAAHPTEHDLLSTGNSDGLVCLWDFKTMKKPLSMIEHPRTVSGLEFSPILGQYLLSTCRDDNLRIMQCSSGQLKVMNKIRHDNDTGRWLTTFRPCFLPESENHFVTGSKIYPRQIEVWDVNGHLVHKFKGEEFSSVTSVNDFHPHKKIVAGGNASGKVLIFQDEPEFCKMNF